MDDLINRQVAIANYQRVCRTVKCGDCPFRIEDGVFTDCRLERFLHELPSEEQQRWNPVKTKPMDEEERAYWSDQLGYDFEYEDAVMFDCKMPDDGQEVLVSYRKWVNMDKCEIDGGLYGLEGNGDWDGVTAWMPLPEPWKGETE